jgi:formylglycine-generating enzyme required for sulfatase activity
VLDPPLFYHWPGRGGVKEDTGGNEDGIGIRDDQSRIFRGGSIELLALDVRSAYRLAHRPSFVHDLGGFRVARTCR